MSQFLGFRCFCRVFVVRSAIHGLLYTTGRVQFNTAQELNVRESNRSGSARIREVRRELHLLTEKATNNPRRRVLTRCGRFSSVERPDRCEAGPLPPSNRLSHSKMQRRAASLLVSITRSSSAEDSIHFHAKEISKPTRVRCVQRHHRSSA